MISQLPSVFLSPLKLECLLFELACKLLRLAFLITRQTFDLKLMCLFNILHLLFMPYPKLICVDIIPLKLLVKGIVHLFLELTHFLSMLSVNLSKLLISPCHNFLFLLHLLGNCIVSILTLLPVTLYDLVQIRDGCLILLTH